MKNKKRILFIVIFIVALIMIILPNSVRAENEKIKEVNVTVKGPEVGTVIKHGTEQVTIEIPDSEPYVYTADILTPKPNATVSGDANYKVGYSYWIKYLPSMGNEYEYDPKNTTFEISKNGKYYVEVGITPKEGYEFADDVVLKVNGATSGFELNQFNYANQCMFYMEVTPVVAAAEEQQPAEENKQEEQKPAEENKQEEQKNEEANVVAEDTENKEEVAAAEEVSKLVDEILAGKDVEGISKEVATKIKEAKAAGKSIKVEVETPEVKAEEVEEDAKKIDEKIGEKGNIAALFDINVLIKADGTTLGKATKLGDKITIALAVPQDLPAVPAGYTREFTVVSVHDGEAKERDTRVSGDTIYTDVDEFSTYAITYKDVKNTSNPKTGDAISLYVATLALVTVGAIVVLKKIK